MAAPRSGSADGTSAGVVGVLDLTTEDLEVTAWGSTGAGRDDTGVEPQTLFESAR